MRRGSNTHRTPNPRMTPCTHLMLVGKMLIQPAPFDSRRLLGKTSLQYQPDVRIGWLSLRVWALEERSTEHIFTLSVYYLCVSDSRLFRSTPTLVLVA